MRPPTSLLTFIFLYPLSVVSQAATTTTPDTSQQTIVPFSTLPACAAKCGPLYDAQGACSPPVVPATDLNCFCQYGKLLPFQTSTANVCDAACPDDPTGLSKIQQWYVGLCAQRSQATATPTDSQGTTTGTPASGSSESGGSSSGSSSNQNATWISTHWQWVIMIVVLALAISIGWILACFFRRRYVQRKEREYELRPPAAPWVAGDSHPREPGSNRDSVTIHKGKHKDAGAGMFAAPGAARMSEKPNQKKWVVKERT